MMLLPDVNVWIAAFLELSPDSGRVRTWLEDALDGPIPLAVPESVMVSVVRVATQIADVPPLQAVEFVKVVMNAPASEVISPGPRFWPEFERLLLESGARGRKVTDAALAALAIEHDCTVVTFDRDFKRFDRVRSMPPTLD